MGSNNEKPLGTNTIISGPVAAAGPRLLSGKILDKNQCNLLLRDVAMLKGAFSSCWRDSTVFAQMKEECSTVNGIPSFIFLLKRLGTDALASQGATAKGYRFAASPDVYQSGGRHSHNHIINKKGGENHFKIAAYRKAAKVLEDYPIDVAEAYQKGGIKALTEISGIGAALSKKIAEFIETGRMKKYEEVMAQKPKGR